MAGAKKPEGKVIYRGRYLTFRETKNSLYLVPTREGRAKAKEMLEERRPTEAEEIDMFEDAFGNGWSLVRPEDIGALTDATIISEDGFIGADGKWYAYPDAEGARVFAHMDYAVEDPIETWAHGEPVRYVREPLELSPEYRRKAEKKYSREE